MDSSHWPLIMSGTNAVNHKTSRPKSVQQETHEHDPHPNSNVKKVWERGVSDAMFETLTP